MRIAAILLLLMSGAALAAEDEVWETVGAWTVRINSDDVSRCFATRVMEDGSEVQIGTEPTLDGGYFAIYNPAWTHIEDGAEGTVEFNFASSRFGGDAVGRIKNGVPGGYVFFDNPAFVQEFAKRQSVKVSGTRGAAFEMDLTGTATAIRTILACQDAQPDPAPAAETDPAAEN